MLQYRKQQIDRSYAELNRLREMQKFRQTHDTEPFETMSLAQLHMKHQELRKALSKERQNLVASFLYVFPIKRITGSDKCIVADLLLPVQTPLTALPSEVALATVSYITHALNLLGICAFEEIMSLINQCLIWM